MALFEWAFVNIGIRNFLKLKTSRSSRNTDRMGTRAPMRMGLGELGSQQS